MHSTEKLNLKHKKIGYTFRGNITNNISMDHGKILHFITEKIEDLGGAIFYSYSKSPLRINNTIIHCSRIDSCGALYFFIKRPGQSVSEFEKEFPAGLNYFKKGKS